MSMIEKGFYDYHRNPTTLDYCPEFDSPKGLVGFLGYKKKITPCCERIAPHSISFRTELSFSLYINKIKNNKTLIIVEGKKDKKALQSFGLKNIIELNKKPLFEIIENISLKNKYCIILTDLDKKGKELYGKLNSGLQRFGVKIDNTFREFLFKNTKIRQIEGLVKYSLIEH